jgi:hypothetical protein
MVEFMPDTDQVDPQMENEPVPLVSSASDHKNLFVYTSETPRVYVARGLEVNHGDVVEWPIGAPDVCWDSVTDSKDN